MSATTLTAGYMLAVEYGYKGCERGDNLQLTLAKARDLLGPPSTPHTTTDARQWGYTWPVTSSDRTPVASFKAGAAKVLRHMADQEATRRGVAMRLTKEKSISVAREDAWREAAKMLDNIIIEGE